MEELPPVDKRTGLTFESLIANDKYNINSQLIIAFCSGLIFSPWSYGWVFYIVFLLIWELLYALATRCKPSKWNPWERILLIVVSLLGWTIGRILVGYDPFSNKRKRIKNT